MRDCYLVERIENGVEFIVLKSHFEKYKDEYKFIKALNAPEPTPEPEVDEGPSESDLRFILKDQYGITFKGRKSVEQMLEMLKEAEEKAKSEE